MARETTRSIPGSQTLARGLLGLEILAEAEAGLTAADFARSLGVHASIGYRILQTLATRGLARRDGDGRFRLGLGILALAQNALAGLRSTASPIVRSLANDTSTTSFLYVQEGDEAVALVSFVPNTAMYGNRLLEGSRHPIDRGSAGYALQSLAPPSSGEPTKVREARDRGVAVSGNELTVGGWGASVPLDPDILKLRACISIAGFDEKAVEASLPRLLRAAGDLNRAIRGPSDGTLLTR